MFTAALILYAPTFLSMQAIWERDSTFTHGYFIPLITAWLLWRDREVIAASRVRPALQFLPVVFLLVLIWLCAEMTSVQVVRQYAATSLLSCAVLVLVGWETFRRIAFPLLYLLFAVPFGDFLIPRLIEFTTEFVVAAVRMTGIPIYREGANFMLPSGSFEVIKTCSGISFLLASVTLGTLFAWLNFSSWWKRLCFVAISFAVPIVANGLRAFGVVMLVHLSDMRYGTGFDHVVYGWIFFGIVTLVLFWVGTRFGDPSTPMDRQVMQPGSVPSVDVRFASVVLAAVLAIGPFGAWAWRQAAEASVTADDGSVALVSIPAPWQGPAAVDWSWRPEFAQPSQARAGRYLLGTQEVSVFVRDYKHEYEGNEATSSPLVGGMLSGWRVDASRSLVLANGNEVEAAVIAGHNGDNFRIWRWYLIDGVYVGDPRAAKWIELQALMRGRRPVSSVICIGTKLLSPSKLEVDAADRLLADFVAVGTEQLELYGKGG